MNAAETKTRFLHELGEWADSFRCSLVSMRRSKDALEGTRWFALNMTPTATELDEAIVRCCAMADSLGESIAEFEAVPAAVIAKRMADDAERGESARRAMQLDVRRSVAMATAAEMAVKLAGKFAAAGR